MLVVAGAYGALMRMLRLDRRTLLGDLQIGRALRSAGIDWATWADDDLASGCIERELVKLADGVPSARKFRQEAR